MDAASKTDDDVRELIENSNIAQLRKRKIFIIDEIHMLSNKLLMT